MPEIDTAAPEGYTYLILVDDNFDYQNVEKRYQHSEHKNAGTALETAKTIVDTCLLELKKPGMTAIELYSAYTSFGEDPFIQTNDPDFARFSAWSYAKAQCVKICLESSMPRG